MRVNKKVNYSVKIALLSAVAFVVMYLEFPLPFFPPWLKFDFSDVPALLGGFALGPVAGAMIELVKVVLFFIFKNSGTGGVGELANLLMGLALVLPAALIYKRRKNIQHALIGLTVGLVVMTGMAGLLNYYILIPAYSKFMPIETIIEICKGINPNMNTVEAYVYMGAMPFTALKGLFECLVTLLLYKRLSKLLHKRF